jgi:hypothetical protein
MGKRRRHPIWLSNEALAAGQRLAAVTGLTVLELVEAALLGVEPGDLTPEEPGTREIACPAAPRRHAGSRPRPSSPARVIPIERARARRCGLRAAAPVAAVESPAVEPQDLPTTLRQAAEARDVARDLCERSRGLRQRSMDLAAVSHELLRAREDVWDIA